MQSQWADTLLAAERVQVARAGVWALLSIAAGTGVLALLRVRRAQSALLSRFATVQLVLGLLLAAQVVWWRSQLAQRDLASAVRLDRLAWFGAGVDVGLILLGGTLVIVGRERESRLAIVGVGLGVAVQGAARLLLDSQLGALVAR